VNRQPVSRNKNQNGIDAANAGEFYEDKIFVASILAADSPSFVTGITEPIEFTFLFTSPLLYFIHAVYTGLAGAVLYLLHIRHGFSWGPASSTTY